MKFRFFISLLSSFFLVVFGCKEERKIDSQPIPDSHKEVLTASPTETLEEAAFLCYAGSMFVGTETRQTLQNSTGTLCVQDLSTLELNRYGKNVKARVQHTETLTKTGNLLGFTTKVEMGGVPMVYSAAEPTLEGQKLSLDVKIQSQNMEQTQNVQTILPEGLSGGYGGYGTETLLICTPILLGESRKLVRLNPTMLRWELVEIQAEAAENVTLPNGSIFPLLRVETRSQMLKPDGTPDPAQIQNETLWCDGKGRVWKRFSPLMNLAAWRSSKVEIAQFTQSGKFPPAPASSEEKKNTESLEQSMDFAENLNVPLKLNLTNGKTTDFMEVEEGTYIVSVSASATERTPIQGLFENSDFQKVQELDPFRVQITVRKSTAERFSSVPVQAITPDEKNAGSMIQSDAPEIKILAQKILPGETDSEKLAPALERFVFEFIVNKNYSRGFVTALEVAQNPSGDCTEHAVLLAALARSRGIPARVVQGLIFEKKSGKMAWHVWNELYVNGNWKPFDATIGRGFVGVNHLRINAGSFSTATLAQTLVPAARLIGKIEIEYSIPEN